MIIPASETLSISQQTKNDEVRRSFKLTPEQINNRIQNAALKGETFISLACPDCLADIIILELQELGYTITLSKGSIQIRWG